MTDSTVFLLHLEKKLSKQLFWLCFKLQRELHRAYLMVLVSAPLACLGVITILDWIFKHNGL